MSGCSRKGRTIWVSPWGAGCGCANARTATTSDLHDDVFTSEPLLGHQLAICTDGRGLTIARMQRIAREMNFSESTSILPAESADTGERMRIISLQGGAMGRASRVHIDIAGRAGAISRVRVGGEAVLVCSGELFV